MNRPKLTEPIILLLKWNDTRRKEPPEPQSIPFSQRKPSILHSKNLEGKRKNSLPIWHHPKDYVKHAMRSLDFHFFFSFLSETEKKKKKKKYYFVMNSYSAFDQTSKHMPWKTSVTQKKRMTSCKHFFLSFFFFPFFFFPDKTEASILM